MKKDLRNISNINDFLKEKKIMKLQKIYGKEFVLKNLQEAIKIIRLEILNTKKYFIKTKINLNIISYTSYLCEQKNTLELKNVFNGTGVLLHTSLGRAPISKKAIDAICSNASDYLNLEFNLTEAKKEERDARVVKLLKNLTGCEDALIVNNNTSAIILILSTLCNGKEAIISRGDLIEIGNSFRLPDIMLLGKPILKEIGTANITNLKDYKNVINENTKIIIKVHKSNFILKGFQKSVPIKELIDLGKEYKIPVYYDLGSGSLIDMSFYSKNEEITIQKLIKKSIDLVSFSGDKLLGGTQAGIILGKKIFIEKLKKNQLLRALRTDKLILTGLEATLKSYLISKNINKEIPIFIMLNQSEKELKKKAIILYQLLLKNINNCEISLIKTKALFGGGAMPDAKIKSFGISLKFKNKEKSYVLYKKLLQNETPLITRMKNNQIIIDIIALKKENLEIISKQIIKKLKENI